MKKLNETRKFKNRKKWVASSVILASGLGFMAFSGEQQVLASTNSNDSINTSDIEEKGSSKVDLQEKTALSQRSQVATKNDSKILGISNNVASSTTSKISEAVTKTNKDKEIFEPQNNDSIFSSNDLKSMKKVKSVEESKEGLITPTDTKPAEIKNYDTNWSNASHISIYTEPSEDQNGQLKNMDYKGGIQAFQQKDSGIVIAQKMKQNGHNISSNPDGKVNTPGQYGYQSKTPNQISFKLDQDLIDQGYQFDWNFTKQMDADRTQIFSNQGKVEATFDFTKIPKNKYYNNAFQVFIKKNSVPSTELHAVNKNSNESWLYWIDDKTGSYLGTTVIDDYTQGLGEAIKYYSQRRYPNLDTVVQPVNGNTSKWEETLYKIDAPQGYEWAFDVPEYGGVNNSDPHEYDGNRNGFLYAGSVDQYNNNVFINSKNYNPKEALFAPFSKPQSDYVHSTIKNVKIYRLFVKHSDPTVITNSDWSTPTPIQVWGTKENNNYIKLHANDATNAFVIYNADIKKPVKVVMTIGTRGETVNYYQEFEGQIPQGKPFAIGTPWMLPDKYTYGDSQINFPDSRVNIIDPIKQQWDKYPQWGMKVNEPQYSSWKIIDNNNNTIGSFRLVREYTQGPVNKNWYPAELRKAIYTNWKIENGSSIINLNKDGKKISKIVINGESIDIPSDGKLIINGTLWSKFYKENTDRALPTEIRIEVTYSKDQLDEAKNDYEAAKKDAQVTVPDEYKNDSKVKAAEEALNKAIANGDKSTTKDAYVAAKKDVNDKKTALEKAVQAAEAAKKSLDEAISNANNLITVAQDYSKKDKEVKNAIAIVNSLLNQDIDKDNTAVIKDFVAKLNKATKNLSGLIEQHIIPYIPSYNEYDGLDQSNKESEQSFEHFDVQRVVSHNAYVYDKNGERVGTIKYTVNMTVKTANSITVINGKDYYQIGDNQYIKVANFIATKKALTHNAYVYAADGITRVNSKTLKRGKIIYVYELKSINGKNYYRVKGGYIKASNFEKVKKLQGVAKRLRYNAFVYNSKGKKVSYKLLKRHSIIKTYGVKMIQDKKYYKIGKNQYIKAVNFR